MMQEPEKLTIACVGEAMIELNVDRQDRQIGFAGDTLNTAVYLARCLGDTASIEFVSVVGKDALSQHMAEFIRSENVGTSRLLQHETRLPGIYSIAVDAAGERRFSYWRDQSAARTLFETGFDQLTGVDVIYLSGITLAILPAKVRDALLTYLKSATPIVVFDSNYRPRLWEDTETARHYMAEAWRVTDIALPSVDDEMALFGDPDAETVLQRLQSYGLKKGALKRGSAGPLPITGTSGNTGYPKAGRVVDTTAAGDSFSAAYLAAILSGSSNDEAMLAGHSLAAQVIGAPGAIMPKNPSNG